MIGTPRKVVVNLYLMRHGEKDGDQLSKLGAAQVAWSAKRNLSGLTFDRFMCSLFGRALRTVITVVKALGWSTKGVIIEASDSFSYEEAPFLAKYAEYSAEVKRREEAGESVTVATWLEVAPTLIGYLRKKISDALLEAAETTHFSSPSDEKKDEYNVFVGNHTPVAEAACLNPAKTPMLREGDLMKYTVEISFIAMADVSTDIKSKIVASEYIPRGFDKLELPA